MTAPTPVTLGADDLAALVRRLREINCCAYLYVFEDAADAIEALQAQVEADAAERELVERERDVAKANAQWAIDQMGEETARADAAESALSDERAASAAMKAALEEVRQLYFTTPFVDSFNAQICFEKLFKAREIADAALALHTAAGERRDDR